MSELYVCKQYDTPYERVCAIITTLEKHDEEIRADERKKAEQDFQNSDYWNDYLAKVIADARAEEREKVLDEVIEILGNDFWQIAKVEQLKEQK